MADNVTTQSATLATLPTATTVAAVQATFSGDTVVAGLGVLAKSTGAEGSRVLTTVDPATEGGQTTGNASLASIDGKTPALSGGSVPVTGPLTDTQLRATAVPVSMAAVPTGGATAANQATEIASLASIDAKVATTTGQAAIISALGSPFQAGGSIGNTSFGATQGTAANLNMTEASAAAILAVSGATSGAAVITDASGTIQQYLRGLVKLAITAGAWLVSVTGTIADDATTPGNPVMTGGTAKSPDGTDPGNVSAEDDVTRFISDLNRIQYVRTDNPRAGHVHLDGSSAYTDQSLVAAPGAGLQTIITNITFGSNAATAINFFLEEGSTKVYGPYALEAVAGRGFCSGPIRLPITANTAVTLTTSASIAQAFDMDYFIQKV